MASEIAKRFWRKADLGRTKLLELRQQFERDVSPDGRVVRVKRGKVARKRRKRLLKYAKGFRWGRKAKYRAAKEALIHAWKYAYRDRRVKKREFRKLWQTQISAACRQFGISYSKFIHGLKQKKIELDRKILARLAIDFPEIFAKVVEKIKT